MQTRLLTFAKHILLNKSIDRHLISTNSLNSPLNVYKIQTFIQRYSVLNKNCSSFINFQKSSQGKGMLFINIELNGLGTITISRHITTSHNLYSKKKTKKPSQRDDTYSDEESGSDSDDDSNDEFGSFEEDNEAPDNFKQKEIMLKTMRMDAVLATGLNIPRSSVEEAFYGSKIIVNGIKILKKGTKVTDGDYIDLIVGHEADNLKVQRVRILKIKKDKTSTDKFKVTCRVWKGAFLIEKEKYQYRSKTDDFV